MGRFARFGGESFELFLRWTAESQRALRSVREPFEDDLYVVGPSETVERGDGLRWSCFEAEKGLDRLRICERIHDEASGSWAEFDEWYDEAVAARTRPPWMAWTLIEKLD